MHRGWAYYTRCSIPQEWGYKRYIGRRNATIQYRAYPYLYKYFPVA